MGRASSAKQGSLGMSRKVPNKRCVTVRVLSDGEEFQKTTSAAERLQAAEEELLRLVTAANAGVNPPAPEVISNMRMKIVELEAEAEFEIMNMADLKAKKQAVDRLQGKEAAPAPAAAAAPAAAQSPESAEKKKQMEELLLMKRKELEALLAERNQMSAEEAALQAQVAPKKESPLNPGKLADVTPEVAEVAAEIAYEKKSELSANKAAMQANIKKQFAEEVEKAAAPTAGTQSPEDKLKAKVAAAAAAKLKAKVTATNAAKAFVTAEASKNVDPASSVAEKVKAAAKAAENIPAPKPKAPPEIGRAHV